MTRARLIGVLSAAFVLFLLAVGIRAAEEKNRLCGFTAWLGAMAEHAAAERAAEEEDKTPTPYVVIVGISNYADKQIKPRPKAEDDAKALYDLFTSKAYFGAEPNQVRLLLGTEDPKRKSEIATHKNIIDALHWMAVNARKDDPTIFVFIGQGCSLGERGDRLCYFAADSTVKGRDKDAIAGSEIAQELDKLKSERFCAFIDVNFKGFIAGKDPVPEPTLERTAYREFLAPSNDEEQTTVPGRVLFLATNGMSQSLDLDRHGLFTQVLLDGLKGAADKEGYEPDGLITVDEIAEYLEKQLPELARQHGKTKAEKEQVPFVLGSRATHFELTQNPKAMPKVKERLEKLAQLARDRKLSAPLAAEGKRLLRRMPRLENQRALRRTYQELVDGKITPRTFEERREKLLAEARLKKSEATEFASKVIKCTQLIGDEYVKPVNQGEMVAWAIHGLYRQIEEKVPAEVASRLGAVKKMKEPELLALLTDARQALGKREDLDNQKDVTIALQRMLSHLDPYTTYYDAEMARQLRIDTEASFPGIGIQIRKDGATDMLQVVTPIRGSPAHRAGVLAGDIITKVVRDVDDKGKPLPKPEEISTKGLPLPEAVKKIKGPAGTKVKLTIEREGADKPLEFEIVRGLIQVETVMGSKRMPDGTWDYIIDPENKIGYVRLSSFAKSTAGDLTRVVRGLHKKGMKGMVLDLRFNPGGLLDSAVKVSDLFIDDGVIVSIRPRTEKPITFRGEHKDDYLEFPMVCLVNSGSASGSEIVAACLQDHGRAVIVGERSYGKGSVQNIQDFDGGQIKLTTASFWRPNGKNLNKSSTQGKENEDWGVVPDKGFEVKLTRKERDDLMENQRNQEIIPRSDLPAKADKPEFRDKQLEKALEYLKEQIKLAGRVPAKKVG